MAISFTSALNKEHREDLETLLFFNSLQWVAATGIMSSVDTYGSPRIVDDGDLLRVQIEGLPGVQTLFAVEDSGTVELVGVMVYACIDVETIVLLHIAVVEDYSLSGRHADRMLVMMLLSKLREIARRLRGVRQIRVMYAQGAVAEFRV